MTGPVGYLHDKMDVKILILFIMSRIERPLNREEMFEIAFQDDSLNYFVFIESLDELCESKQLLLDSSGYYRITESGKKNCSVVEDSLAIPVVSKVSAVLREKNLEIRRDSFIIAETTQDEKGQWYANVRYQEGASPVMTLSLSAPTQALAAAMAENMKRNYNTIYKSCFDAATDCYE